MDRRIAISGARPARPSFAAQFQDFLRRNLTWFLIGGLALLIIQDIFGNHGVLAMRRSQEQASSLQKQIDDLNEENRRIQNSVQSLKSDPTTIERIAREEMSLARPGEFVFKTQPAPDSKQTQQPASSAPKHP